MDAVDWLSPSVASWGVVVACLMAGEAVADAETVLTAAVDWSEAG